MVDLRYDVDIAGRGFVVSRRGGRFGRRSIPVQKAQQDTSALPGEQSLNPEDLWRRSFESWHRGAGQASFDRSGSDPFRFDGSWGVDPWSQWQLGLLNETESKLASTATGVKLVVAGSYLYCADGQTLKYTQSITAAGAASWTTVTGTPAADITGLTSDGHRVWVAHGASGIYYTTAGAATATQYSTQPTSIVEYVKGRLMTARDRSVYNIVQPGAESPTFRSVSYNTDAGAATQKTVKRPDGVQEGDLLILIVHTEGADSPTSATGWEVPFAESGSLQRSFVLMNTSHVYIRKAEANEPDAYVVVMPGSTDFSVAVAAYYGADAGIVVDAYDQDFGTSTAPAVAALTTNFINDTILFVGGANGTATWTPPTGFTERLDTQMSSGPTIHLSDKVQAAAGSTGVMTGTLSASVDWMAWAIAIRAAGISDPLYTQGNSNFTWVGFAEGQGDIYAAGYSGDKSLIYRTQVRADGTALDAPVVAGALPDGEIVRSIYGYLGILFIGTDSGVRMAVSDANGDLTIGALINTASPVRCFEGQGRHVWFGLEDYDISRWSSGTLDGLGRLDLTQQTEQLVPAWASDLMVAASTSTTESVQSVVTFQDRRVIAIGSSNGLTRGVYGEKANKVATGYLDSGLVTYGISDTKVATYVDLRHKALVGTAEVYLSTDEGAFGSIGTTTTASSTRPATDPFPAGPTRGDTHELRLRLNRSGAADAVGPTVTRMTLRAEPAPARGRVFQVPLVLAKKLNVDGREVTRDPADDLAFIEALFDSQTLVTYREDATSVSVFVKDYEFVAEHRTDDGRMEQGVCTVTLKAPAQ